MASDTVSVMWHYTRGNQTMKKLSLRKFQMDLQISLKMNIRSDFGRASSEVAALMWPGGLRVSRNQWAVPSETLVPGSVTQDGEATVEAPDSRPQCLDTTENEVNVIAKFNHPNILTYYESFIETNCLFIVMEYAPGGNLHDYLQSKGKHNFMQEEDVIYLLSQLASGIQHIHDHQVLHRDLKTHNIMLNRTQRVIKIGDFGISKILESKSKAFTVLGTPCYLSPELYIEKPYNQKSDIWALGCILHEMLTLQRAFEAESLPALISKIMNGKTNPIPAVYSREIRDLVQSMLSVNPDQRPDIDQVISSPLIFPTLLQLYCDLGLARG